METASQNQIKIWPKETRFLSISAATKISHILIGHIADMNNYKQLLIISLVSTKMLFDTVLTRKSIINIYFKRYFWYEARFCHFCKASEYHYYGQYAHKSRAGHLYSGGRFTLHPRPTPYTPRIMLFSVNQTGDVENAIGKYSP